MSIALALAMCVATDGDSIRCGPERLRLAAIDAPEMSPCPPRRQCAPGDPHASKANLARLIDDKPLRIERLHKDRYRRTIAIIWAGGVNVVCAQLSGGYAIYRRDWDRGGRIARACR